MIIKLSYNIKLVLLVNKLLIKIKSLVVNKLIGININLYISKAIYYYSYILRALILLGKRS